MVSKTSSALVVSLLVWAAACGDDASDGGDETGGRAGGGQATGGSAGKGATGGTAGKGGAATGGAATGGTATGGSSSGGSATGGSAAGSPATGGASAGEGGSGGAGEGGEPGGEGGEGEGGFAGVPQEPEPDALLDLPAGDQYDCSVTRPLELLELPWIQSQLLGGANSGILYSQENPFELSWATLDVNGELGAPSTVYEGDWMASLTGARNGERITVVWSESLEITSSQQQLMVAQIDAEGEVITAAQVVSTSAATQSRPKLVAAGDGYALLWSEALDEQATLKFARLDSAGALVGTPKTLAQGMSIDAGTMIVAGDSFALTYSQYTDRYETYYLALDSEGTPSRSAVLLGSGYITNASLISRGERVLAAWTVFQGGYENQDIAINVRIGWFTRGGNPVGATYDLQKPVVNEQNVEPSWVEFGDDLGLVWAKGGVIYICAGCIPDDHLEFVVLDGESLAPVSNVIQLTNTLNNGGLRRPEVAVSGADLLLVPSITYHVTAEGGSATLRCAE